MATTSPNTYTDVNETGCCAAPDVESWDRRIVHFDEKRFIRKVTRSVLYVPLNMASVMTALQKAAQDAGAAMPPQEVMCLSRDLSPWRAEQLFAVTKEVEGAENVVLTGDFASMAFNGPYRDAGRWCDAVRAFAAETGRTTSEVYLIYLVCPSCAKHYGRNDVIALARLE